jgi:16S rRNA (uracil1498-N3)-methyltransferase
MQCGSAWATEVADPVSLAELIAGARDGVRWLAEAGGSPPPAELDAGPVTVVVGPEGGFTPGEADRLRAAGYHPVSLGPFTLRFETAALAAAAIVVAARQRGLHG